MSRVMRPVHARYMYGYMYGDMRADSRDVSDPLGRGRDRSPGRRGGSHTSRLPYQPGFPAGTARRPFAAAATSLRPRITLPRHGLPSLIQARTRGFMSASRTSALAEPRKNTPRVLFPLFFRG